MPFDAPLSPIRPTARLAPRFMAFAAAFALVFAGPSARAQAPAPVASPAPISAPAAPATPTTSSAAAPAASPDGHSTSAPASSAIASLPRDLSPWGMFMAADLVVKGVMIGLAFASVLTWTIWLAKGLELLFARRRMQRANRILLQAQTLADARRALEGDDDACIVLDAAAAEIEMSAGIADPEGIKERIVSRLERIEAQVARRMSRGTGLLATIGATAPFVGLFGTVWGIMNSFIGISRMQTTNLAVVAPGIAEALLATALGLVAAIPAVVIYNFFSRWVAGYRLLHADASAGVLRLASRDLDFALKARVQPRRGNAVTAAE